MTNFDKIAKLLPEGLSETGIEEISSIVEETIQERVDSEVKALEAKVGGFLRMKLNELKEQAVKELEETNETFRAVKVYESLKNVIAEDISTSDEDSVANQYKKENEELQESVESLNEKISQLMTENNTLEESVTNLNETVDSLSETTKQPFKSSEQALVITNESVNEAKQSTPEVVNSFLTEDVVRLSQFNK
jgi:prophage DNA circulation protein|tara:strand:+ start:433 stop:1011 length:579 start_codon:yes stop_codon:yes gene_type:complete